jgi:uncharacterized protein with GYD domain
MALFVTYASYSRAGIKALLSKPEDRTPAIAALLEKAGGKLIAMYNTTGDNDVVLISEAPDGTDAVALAMAVSSSGVVEKVETVRAWTGSDFVEVIQKAAGLTGAYTPPGG